MTKDEAEELTERECIETIAFNIGGAGTVNIRKVIENNWSQISNQLYLWFGVAWPGIPQVIEDPIGWMLRAYIAGEH